MMSFQIGNVVNAIENYVSNFFFKTSNLIFYFFFFFGCHDVVHFTGSWVAQAVYQVRSMICTYPQSQFVGSSCIRHHFTWFSLNRPVSTLSLLKQAYLDIFSRVNIRSVSSTSQSPYLERVSICRFILDLNFFTFIFEHLKKNSSFDFRRTIGEFIPKIGCN